MQNESVLFLFKRGPLKNSHSILASIPQKKKHVHISFKIPILGYDSFDKLIDFISNE